MPKSYSLEEVKQRIVDILARSEAGLSGVELAEKTGINRVTITKYLNILESMGLVKWDPLESTCRHASLSIL